MNLPVGSVKEENLKTNEFDLVKKSIELMKENFNGYVVITAEGYQGVEEGILFFKKGIIVGSLYEYSKYKRFVYGDSALPMVFNVSKANFGIADIYSLTSQQLDLIIAFNEKLVLQDAVSENDVKKYAVKSYSKDFAVSALSDKLKKEESRYDILRRLGLNRI